MSRPLQSEAVHVARAATVTNPVALATKGVIYAHALDGRIVMTRRDWRVARAIRPAAIVLTEGSPSSGVLTAAVQP